MLLVYSPSFVVGVEQDCWKCGSSNEVITWASNAIHDEATGAIGHAESGEAYLLSYIEDMPAFVSKYMASLTPTYRKLFSLTAGHTYFANVCMCGVNFGDWFLFCEPGGAWFPEDGADILLSRAAALPFVDPFLVDCGFVTRKIAGFASILARQKR